MIWDSWTCPTYSPKFHWSGGRKGVENAMSDIVIEICQQQGNIWNAVEAYHPKDKEF